MRAARKRRPSEIVAPRNRELRAQVWRILAADRCTVGEAWERAVASPASRWWISEERAEQAVGAWLRRPRAARTPRERCYALLARLYAERREADPALTCAAFLRATLPTPAPEYFLSASAARRC